MKRAANKNMTWIDYKYNYMNPIGYANDLRKRLQTNDKIVDLYAFLNLDNPNSDSKRVNKEIYKRIKEILKENQDAVIVITGAEGNSVSVENIPTSIKIDGKKYPIEKDVDKPKNISYNCNVKKNPKSKGETQWI